MPRFVPPVVRRAYARVEPVIEKWGRFEDARSFVKFIWDLREVLFVGGALMLGVFGFLGALIAVFFGWLSDNLLAAVLVTCTALILGAGRGYESAGTRVEKRLSRIWDDDLQALTELIDEFDAKRETDALRLEKERKQLDAMREDLTALRAHVDARLAEMYRMQDEQSRGA